MELSGGEEMAGDDVYGHFIAAGVMLLTSLVGLSTNILSIFLLARCSETMNSFEKLCISHHIANVGVLTIFVVYAVPIQILMLPVGLTWYGKIFGQLGVFFWNVCVYTQLAIALNRMLAITFPIRVQILLSDRNTFIGIFAVWALGFLHIIPYFNQADCYLWYSEILYIWNFAVGSCGELISLWLDYYTGMTICTVVGLIDVFTLLRVRMYYKKSGASSSRTSKQRRMEIRFFVQTCVHFCLFMTKLGSFYFLSVLAEGSRWETFFTTTFAWCGCHACDGIVTVVFHRFSSSTSNGRSRNSTLQIVTVSPAASSKK